MGSHPNRLLQHRGCETAPKLRYRVCGETAISVEFGDAINLEVNRKVHQLHRRIVRDDTPGVLAAIPTYRSLLIQYDPWECSLEELLLRVERLLTAQKKEKQESAVLEVPVCYEAEFGPDLEDLAVSHGMSVEEVIALHSASEYQVYMIGFTPGFPYLGGLNPRLFTPRRQIPRVRVPAGSVAIADQQAGIYPIDSPGGWHLIGRTPLQLFDPQRSPPFLIEAGASIRFKRIGRDEFISHRNN